MMKMHLEEKTLFELDIKVKFKPHEILPSNLYIVWPMQFGDSLKLLRPTVWEGYAFTRKYKKIHYLTLDLAQVMATQDVAQCPQYHVTYVPAKVEVATVSGLGEDTITTKRLLDLLPMVKVTRKLHSTP